MNDRVEDLDVPEQDAEDVKGGFHWGVDMKKLPIGGGRPPSNLGQINTDVSHGGGGGAG